MDASIVSRVVSIMASINDLLKGQPSQIPWPSYQQILEGTSTYQYESLNELKQIYTYCINLLANLACNNKDARWVILLNNTLEVFGFSLDYFSSDESYFDSALWFLESIL